MGDPAFSRARNPDLPVTELSVTGVPKWLVDLLDAEAQSRGDPFRGPVVIEILKEWGERRAVHFMLMERIVGSNPEFREFAAQALRDRKS